MTETILWYFVAINILTLTVSIMDKGFAVYDKRRVPENALLTMSFVGGAVGAKLAQIISGHKSLKIDFTASLSLIAFLQLSVALAFWSETVREEVSAAYERVAASFEEEEAENVRHVSRDKELPRRFGPGS